MRRLPLTLIPLALAACASPSPEYLGVAPRIVEIEGTEIHVWRRGDRAQAIRKGWVARGAHGAAMARMIRATEQATGCTVLPEFTTGDSGVLNMRLDC